MVQIKLNYYIRIEGVNTASTSKTKDITVVFGKSKAILETQMLGKQNIYVVMH